MCQEAGFALCGQFPINLIMSTVKGTQESTLNVDSSVLKPLPTCFWICELINDLMIMNVHFFDYNRVFVS